MPPAATPPWMGRPQRSMRLVPPGDLCCSAMHVRHAYVPLPMPKKNRSDITPDPGGHRPQRPCAQGRTRVKQDQAQASARRLNRRQRVVCKACMRRGHRCGRTMAAGATCSGNLMMSVPAVGSGPCEVHRTTVSFAPAATERTMKSRFRKGPSWRSRRRSRRGRPSTGSR